MPMAGLAALLLLAAAAGARAQTAPGALVLAVRADAATTVSALLDPRAAAWRDAPAQPLRFSRTPPLYYGDPLDDDTRPTATVSLIRIASGSLVARLRWTDPARDEAGQGAVYPDAGQSRIYKKHSESANTFADAACIMVPVRRGPAARYPALTMGESAQPVQLFYWRAGLGFQQLGGHGRASTAMTGSPAMGRAVWEDGAWTVTLAIPGMKPRTPISFAIWEGAKEHRDGLKFFTVWHEAQ